MSDLEMEHARLGAAHDGGIVQRRETTARGGAVVLAANERRLEHHARLRLVLIADELGERRLEGRRIDLRQEADAPGVDAENGHVDASQRARGAQEGAVATEHDQALRVGQALDERFRLARFGRPCLRAVLATPISSALGKLDRGRLRWIECETEALHRPKPRWSRNSRLPAGPRSGDSISPRTSKPRPRANAATRSTTARRTCGSRTTPFGASAGSGLELRLDQRHDLAVACERGFYARQHARQRDERDVDDRQADRLGQRRRDRARQDRVARHACAPSTRPAGRCAAHRRAVRGPRREHRRARHRGAAERR